MRVKTSRALILFRDGVNLFIFVYITANAIAFRFTSLVYYNVATNIRACVCRQALRLSHPLGCASYIALTKAGGKKKGKGKGRGFKVIFTRQLGLSRKDRVPDGPRQSNPGVFNRLRLLSPVQSLLLVALFFGRRGMSSEFKRDLRDLRATRTKKTHRFVASRSIM